MEKDDFLQVLNIKLMSDLWFIKIIYKSVFFKDFKWDKQF